MKYVVNMTMPDGSEEKRVFWWWDEVNAWLSNTTDWMRVSIVRRLDL